MSVKRITADALLLALALVCYLIENYLPPLLPYAPGVKIGLGNIFIFLSIILCGGGDALVITVLKCLLGSIFSGNLFSLVYAFPSACMSFATMFLLYRYACAFFSVTGISVLSSCVFNAVQVAVSAAVLCSVAIFAYLPYVILIGGFVGAFTGAVVYFTIKKLPEKTLRNMIA